MRRFAGGFAAILAALAVLVLSPPLADAAVLPSAFKDEVVFEDLREPTNFKFAPDGRTFVAEKNGKIVVFPKESGPSETPTVFADLRKQVYDNGDHGLLGLALDPKFDEGQPYVYALYSFDHELGKPLTEVPRWGDAAHEYEGDECPHREVGEPGPGGEIGCLVSGRLMRFTAEGNHAVPSATSPQEEVLLEGWCQQSTTHSIGDLRFGPEGALFVSGGEGGMFSGGADWGQYGNPCGDPPGHAGENLLPEGAEGGSLRSQSLLRPAGEVLLSGALLRVDPDTGEGWPGNPLAGSANANARRIIGIGFRNPYRFTLNPRTGAAFVNNVGNGQTEEIDRVPVGSSSVYNSGWPCFEGLVKNYQWEHLGNAACQELYNQTGSTEEPFFHYQHSSPIAPGDPCPIEEGSAITGSTFYEGSTYPSSYDGALFFSDAVRGCLYVMFADEDGKPDPLNVVPFLSETSNYPGVDLEQGPDGNIYYASLYVGTINRIAYDPGAPRAALKVVDGTHPWGQIPFRAEFDARESTDPGGHPLKYRWDLNGDGKFADGADSPLEHETYGESENVQVSVEVEDTVNHRTSIARVSVYPGDSPPAVSISEPLESSTWGVGQDVHFAGSAKADAGQGDPIPADGLYWKARLLHCPGGLSLCHEHPLQVFPAVDSGHVLAPDHDYPSYLHFSLTASDSRGLSAEANVKMQARPVTLQMRSEPAGVPLIVGVAAAQATPFDLQAIEGSLTTVVAQPTATINGTTYTFERWSDDRARVHTLTASAETLTAEYQTTAEEPEGPGPGEPEPEGPGDEQPEPGGPGHEQPEPEGPGRDQPEVPGGDSTPHHGPETHNDPSPSAPVGGPPSLAPPKIKGRPAKQTASRVARFVFGGGDGPRFQCRIDKKKWASCHSPHTYRALKRGNHTFRVRGAGAKGAKPTAAAVFHWRIGPLHRVGTAHARR